MSAEEPKRSAMLDYLGEIDYTVLQMDDYVESYARKLVDIGVLTEKRIDDCRHIGFAVTSNCSMILSWNFRHIVRVKTINGVRFVSSIFGYNEIGIYSPSMIVKGDELDE